MSQRSEKLRKVFSRSKVVTEHSCYLNRKPWENQENKESLWEKSRTLTLWLAPGAPLCNTKLSSSGWARAAEQAAALELLTRLSATQQLRAINPAPDVPTTRRRSRPFPLLPAARPGFLQTSEDQQRTAREEAEEVQGRQSQAGCRYPFIGLSADQRTRQHLSKRFSLGRNFEAALSGPWHWRN